MSVPATAALNNDRSLVRVSMFAIFSSLKHVTDRLVENRCSNSLNTKNWTGVVTTV